jgi:hypothetical protein
MMLTKLHGKKRSQLTIGLATGILFGIFLQKGGVTDYNVILGQLLLEDFTVIKIMLSAVVTGMIGIHFLKSIGLATLHPKPGSFGMSIVGGLIFGVGFATLGYCPGTIAGAVGQGYLDALIGGVTGILVGAGILAAAYPKLSASIMRKGDFGDITIPRLLRVNQWVVVIPFAAGLIALLIWMERAGP